MSATLPSSITCTFNAKSWAEMPFHEMLGAGKLSRASIVNALCGEFEGQGVLEYLLSYPNSEGGDVPFVGYERIVGVVAGFEGSFVVKHDGIFSPKAGVNGTLEIVSGSGTGGFSGIAGSGHIKANAGEHGGQYHISINCA